jgi:Tol biopolymer transport system component
VGDKPSEPRLPLRRVLPRRRSARLAACGDCGTPAWSPDGRWIAFSSDSSTDSGSNGQQRLWIVAAAGGKPHRLTHCPGWCADGAPVWSPDGRLLIFQRDATPDGTVPTPTGPAEVTRLYTVHPDGSHQTRITDGEDPQWSPDGRRITFEDARGIEVANADGSHVQLVFAQTSYGGPGDPSWSPDGKKLVIVNTPAQPPGATSFAVEVWTVNADGTDPQRIYNSGNGALDYCAAIWSPDGRMIAFAVQTSDSTSGTVVINGGTFVISANGTGLKLLTPTIPYSFVVTYNLSWQPLPNR